MFFDVGRNPCLDSSGALKAAVRLNDPVAVKELLDRGASVENESGLDTSLHVAASAGSVKIMELLFHKNAEAHDSLQIGGLARRSKSIKFLVTLTTLICNHMISYTVYI